jgi:hypothetical protein
MATNKKKSAKEKAVAKDTTTTATTAKAENTTATATATATFPQEGAMLSELPPPEKGLLQSPFFIAFLLLAMGVWKAHELRSASIVESSKRCIAFLGDDACKDPLILSLLSLKFHYAMQGICIVFGYYLLVRKTESMLAHINALLGLSPIMAGMSVLLCNLSVIPYPAAKGQCIPAMGLLAMAVPLQKQHQPFTEPRVIQSSTSSSSSLPSMILAMFIGTSFLQAIHCLADSFDLSLVNPVSEWISPWPLHVVAARPAARPILQFFAVDHLSMMFLYAYAWHSFPDATQRVRTTLLSFVSLFVVRHGYMYRGQR